MRAGETFTFTMNESKILGLFTLDRLLNDYDSTSISLSFDHLERSVIGLIMIARGRRVSSCLILVRRAVFSNLILKIIVPADDLMPRFPVSSK